ncbi:hypothetical protein NWFMUON74_11960 [Nocardia wallacei]|uniref:Uncharacterized protein n=1 Tax=Nocardia wallacei TaxID=480035 RepID=A0A7G1KJ36_9NOCA|nr:hypothetical protein NWFMUON74_11960 [Nocardia wallacei]
MGANSIHNMRARTDRISAARAIRRGCRFTARRLSVRLAGRDKGTGVARRSRSHAELSSVHGAHPMPAACEIAPRLYNTAALSLK